MRCFSLAALTIAVLGCGIIGVLGIIIILYLLFGYR